MNPLYPIRFHPCNIPPEVQIDPGKTAVVEFELPVEELAFYGADMIKKVEPGDFHLWVSGDSASGNPLPFVVE